MNNTVEWEVFRTRKFRQFSHVFSLAKFFSPVLANDCLENMTTFADLLANIKIFQQYKGTFVAKGWRNFSRVKVFGYGRLKAHINLPFFLPYACTHRSHIYKIYHVHT